MTGAQMVHDGGKVAKMGWQARGLLPNSSDMLMVHVVIRYY